MLCGLNAILPDSDFTHNLYPVLLYRIVYPPIHPGGGSDLFPGPGAGMYPSRYLRVTSHKAS